MNSEGILSCDQDLSRVLSAAGQVEQAEQHTGWTDPQEFVEIAGHALVVVHGGDFRTAQKRHIGMPRIGRHIHFAAAEQGANKIRRRQSQRANDSCFLCHG